MAEKFAYKVTGLVILIIGLLFFLRDIGINYIGDTSGWTIFIVLVGAALLGSQGLDMTKPSKKIPIRL